MNIIPVGEIQIMAMAVAKSGLFGVKTPEQAMALMLIAQAEGLHPAIAARDYHVINGKPALKADAMLSRFQAAGGKVEWKEYTGEKCIGIFSHAQGGSVEVIWTLAMATKAGLTNNPTWNKFSRAMLRARCISEGIRTVYPGVISGFYTPEEVQDFTQPEEKDITPTATPEKKAANVAKAKAAIAPNTISGDPTEGVLPPLKPLQSDIDKMLAVFATIGCDMQAVEKIHNKHISEWTTDDMTEAREVYKSRKIEYEIGLQKSEDVI